MKTTFISTNAIGSSVRTSIARSQQQLTVAQKELSSGVHNDIGLEVKGGYASLVHIRQERQALEALTDTNAVLSTRLEVTQTSLQSIVDGAQEFLAEVIGSAGTGGQQVIQDQGASRLTALSDMLNTSFDGAFLFSGANFGVRPFESYSDPPPSGPKLAIDAAFLAEFGVTQSDPAVYFISDAAMGSFLSGSYSAEFQDPAWSNWSSASNQLSSVRVSSGETVQPSVSANEAPFRKLASVYNAAANLGTADLNEASFKALSDWLARTTAEAVEELTLVQARIGTAQGRIEDATDRLQIQIDLFDERILKVEGVDPYEASTRLTSLLTQIQTSYAATARIQQLSILNFL